MPDTGALMAVALPLTALDEAVALEIWPWEPTWALDADADGCIDGMSVVTAGSNWFTGALPPPPQPTSATPSTMAKED
ncbi:hypothetical protein [Noviherbaspirillum malthae]|uniref:hypothetical protein n=1 Tax=Noviherbaspirillum malthae TaxID=1260987 RepID=UPI00188FEACF|nr:hypothetical protein [Noviherbaspirillum malthae]